MLYHIIIFVILHAMLLYCIVSSILSSCHTYSHHHNMLYQIMSCCMMSSSIVYSTNSYYSIFFMFSRIVKYYSIACHAVWFLLGSPCLQQDALRGFHPNIQYISPKINAYRPPGKSDSDFCAILKYQTWYFMNYNYHITTFLSFSHFLNDHW